MLHDLADFSDVCCPHGEPAAAGPSTHAALLLQRENRWLRARVERAEREMFERGLQHAAVQRQLLQAADAAASASTARDDAEARLGAAQATVDVLAMTSRQMEAALATLQRYELLHRCVVCAVSERSISNPCGHVSMCGHCALRGNACPLCGARYRKNALRKAVFV
jgi:rubrerythrin